MFANLVELEKCCKTHVYLQKSPSIQPRTSPLKICKILQKLPNVPILLVLKAALRRGGGARQSLRGDGGGSRFPEAFVRVGFICGDPRVRLSASHAGG